LAWQQASPAQTNQKPTPHNQTGHDRAGHGRHEHTCRNIHTAVKNPVMGHTNTTRRINQRILKKKFAIMIYEEERKICDICVDDGV